MGLSDGGKSFKIGLTI